MLEVLITVLVSVIGTWFFIKKTTAVKETKDTKEIEREATVKAYNSDIHKLVDDVVSEFGSDSDPGAKNVASKKPEEPV